MLQRITLKGWFLIILVGLYATYNPLGLSVFHWWTLTGASSLLPLKVLASLVLVSGLGLVLYGVFRSISAVGLLMIVAILAAMMWTVHSVVAFNLLNPLMWGWIIQPLLAVVLVVGWQWPRIWRRSTGAMMVEDVGDHQGHHH